MMNPDFVKKTLLLNQSNIRKAMRHFNVDTETEAVNKALSVTAEEADLIVSPQEIAGMGGIVQV